MTISAIRTFAAAVLVIAGSAAHAAETCPNGGTVRFGVEPFGPAQQLTATYNDIARLIEARLGCKVQVYLVANYNAEIEAMRAHRLEFAQFGPLGYLLAHQLARAEAVATFTGADGKAATYTSSILVRADSPIHGIADLKNHSFAYTDPVSTSGHLLPAHAIKSAGFDPDRHVRGVYTGSAAASFEALRNRKVDAAALISTELKAALDAGQYDPAQYRILWQSPPLPADPIAVSADLPPDFKARLTGILTSLDLRQLPEADRKFLISLSKDGLGTTPQTDAAFDPLRQLVSALNIDLSKP